MKHPDCLKKCSSDLAKNRKKKENNVMEKITLLSSKPSASLTKNEKMLLEEMRSKLNEMCPFT